jgi:sporulation protein YlmC with PRC-barrel domain
MQFKRKNSLLSAVLVPVAFAVCIPVLAQNVDTAGKSTQQIQAQAMAPDMRASKVIGKQVKNPQGENLGKIEDLVINLGTEKLQYAVISSGGVLGMGDKLFAYPAELFKTTGGAEGKEEFILAVDKEQLKKAPGFERNRKPNWSLNTYRSQVDSFFFKEDTAKRTTTGRLMSASDLLGKDVNDRAAHSAGEIEELVVNFGNGRTYAILDFDKAWNPDDKLLALPLSAFTFPARPDIDIFLNIQRDKIDMARSFDENNWPNLNDAKYRNDLSGYLSSMQQQSDNTGRSSGGSK